MSQPRVSIFEQAAEDRANQQEKLERTVVEGQVEKPKKKTIAISMNIDDHERLKRYAMEKGKSVSGIIKDWVDKYCR